MPSTSESLLEARAPRPASAGSVLDLVPVVPVVVVHTLETALPLARALARGGVPVVELTLRTPVALEALRLLADEAPEVVVGAGTVVDPWQAEAAADAGASFLVSPGVTPRLLDAMRETALPFLPGVATVGEALAAREAGCRELKFFPAEQSGGAGFLKAVGSVLPDVRFCPTGGVNEANAASYLALSNVGCVGGSWLTPPDAVAAGDWDRVTALAAATRDLR